VRAAKHDQQSAVERDQRSAAEHDQRTTRALPAVERNQRGGVARD